LADAMRGAGVKVRSHPWTLPDRSEAAVMVGGNSMAHVYLGLDASVRPTWPRLRSHWEPRLESMLSHPSVDLLSTKQSETVVQARRGPARAEILATRDGYSYRAVSDDPLGI